MEEYFAGRRTVKSISEEARVNHGTVYRWIRNYKPGPEDALPESGNDPASEAENLRLKKRIADLEEQLEIAKDWVAYTSKFRK